MRETDQQSSLVEKLLHAGPQQPQDTSEVSKLCDVIRQTSFDILKFLRSGHLEKVYENALAYRLGKIGIHVIQQHPLDVRDEDGTLLGHFCADLFVENTLVIEVKACRLIVDEHVAQLLGYLRASRIEHGLLINFDGPKLQIKKYILNKNS